MEKINFYNTNISNEAIVYATDTLKSTMISAGKKANEFEMELSKKGLINPVTLNSGTVTMMLALKALGIGKGDEVLLPAQTFIATGMAILQVGATPIFVDIELTTGNINPADMVTKITNKTKAVIVVHWAGYPCDMDEILKICKNYKLSCIEDAAHAFGATYKNRPIGSISDFTSFSFQAIKHLTTGDGGALCCLNTSMFNKVKKLRWFGIDRDNSKESILGEREYDVDEIGYKAHMNDLAASLGLGNLKNIDTILERHREIANMYDNAFDGNTKIRCMEYKNDRVSTYWLYPILIENRIEFIEKLKNKGIPTSVVHLGIDKNSIFGGKLKTLSEQRMFDNMQIHLPIHSGLSNQQVEYIIDTVNKI